MTALGLIGIGQDGWVSGILPLLLQLSCETGESLKRDMQPQKEHWSHTLKCWGQRSNDDKLCPRGENRDDHPMGKRMAHKHACQTCLGKHETRDHWGWGSRHENPNWPPPILRETHTTQQEMWCLIAQLKRFPSRMPLEWPSCWMSINEWQNFSKEVSKGLRAFQEFWHKFLNWTFQEICHKNI